MAHPFPYETGTVRRIKGKPETYKGWTIWHYQVWCQQTGAKHGEWRDMTLAVRGGHGEVLVGCVYQKIDALDVHMGAAADLIGHNHYVPSNMADDDGLDDDDRPY